MYVLQASNLLWKYTKVIAVSENREILESYIRERNQERQEIEATYEKYLDILESLPENTEPPPVEPLGFIALFKRKAYDKAYRAWLDRVRNFSEAQKAKAKELLGKPIELDLYGMLPPQTTYFIITAEVW